MSAHLIYGGADHYVSDEESSVFVADILLQWPNAARAIGGLAICDLKWAVK